ncbi:hypothetical protein Taro_037597 [Colocasia esculenta]|uniref:Uncharacterized protein n=1 Tax=Colocasia esculenta TaxID=4460 RepID=A0A843W4J5_COLES|nr:hypothetical protein [Colocasia esculenta]
MVCPGGGTVVFVFQWWYLMVVGGQADLILLSTPNSPEDLFNLPHPALCQQWLTLPLKRGQSHPLESLHDGRTTMAMLLRNWSWSLSLSLQLSLKCSLSVCLSLHSLH